MKFEPHDYQKYCIEQIVNVPFCGLFLDMGLGKTVITLEAIRKLKYLMFQVRKVLIIAPKKVAEATWTDEAAKWDDLKGLRFSLILGDVTTREKAARAEADIYITNRDNTVWLVDYLGRHFDFDMVVLDESSSFKNHRSKRFKALKAVRPALRRLVLLTGTPDPHGLEDLWSQIYLLDGGARLGRTISVYRDLYFLPDKRSQAMIYSYKPRDGAAEAIYDAISDICVSMKADDYLKLPPYIVHDIPVVLDKRSMNAYKTFEKTALLEADGEEITAVSAGVLCGKLLQLCNGAIYTEDKSVIPIHDAKIEAFMELIDSLKGQHVLVFYHFKHDLERLKAALAKTKLRVAEYKSADTARRWNEGRIDVLLAHPASVGYGLNLQQGGHHIVWFGLTYALEEYMQGNARLYRQGQKYPVMVHRLIVKDGIDEDVVRALKDKDKTQEDLLAALKARIKDAHDKA